MTYKKIEKEIEEQAIELLKDFIVPLYAIVSQDVWNKIADGQEQDVNGDINKFEGVTGEIDVIVNPKFYKEVIEVVGSTNSRCSRMEMEHKLAKGLVKKLEKMEKKNGILKVAEGLNAIAKSLDRVKQNI